ncbi:MAG: 50S ribosomal protein L24 [Betaproteobacteria bacterium]|nr:50S ribosomal protein L24 [Betaproteobacteria bacterium]
MSKIKKGDQVVVITGKDKGKRGTVLKVVTELERVVVEGINKAKKHTKPNPMKGTTGGILENEMPIHVSNVAIFNPATGKADRVGYKALEAADGQDARKVRVFKSNGEHVDA